MTWNRALVVLALPLWAACSHAKPEVRAEPAGTAAAAAPAPQTTAREAKACTSDDQCRTGELCVASTCQAIVANMPECVAESAHFDHDRSDLRDADLPMLRRAARCLAAATTREGEPALPRVHRGMLGQESEGRHLPGREAAGPADCVEVTPLQTLTRGTSNRQRVFPSVGSARLSGGGA